MSEEAKWYIVHTYSGYEDKVKSNLEKIVETRNLQGLIKEINIPVEIIEEETEQDDLTEDEVVEQILTNTKRKKVSKPKETKRKIFPGYVMIKMIVTDESWYAVRNIRGCTGFVGTTTDPIPLTDEEVAKLGVNKRTVESSFNIGDYVEIIEGALKGKSGKVSLIDMKEKIIKVLIPLMGVESSVEFDINNVRKID